MSKVKMIPGLRKSKLIASLRRKESIKKKQDRISNYNNNIYTTGYYVRKDKCVNHYEVIDVPEQKKITREYEHKKIRVMNDCGEIIEKFVYIPTIIETVIPAHKDKGYLGCEYVKVPAVPRRINIRMKKLWKKQTSRKLRRRPVTEVYNNGSYKKLLDLCWMID